MRVQISKLERTRNTEAKEIKLQGMEESNVPDFRNGKRVHAGAIVIPYLYKQFARRTLIITEYVCMTCNLLEKIII